MSTPLPEAVREVLRRKMAECGVDETVFDATWECDVAPIFPLPASAEAVRDALAKVDVDYYVTEHGWRYTVLGLKEVEAAHRAEVERAVAAEREECAKIASRTFDATKRESVEWAQRCAAAIRARGGAS